MKRKEKKKATLVVVTHLALIRGMRLTISPRKRKEVCLETPPPKRVKNQAYTHTLKSRRAGTSNLCQRSRTTTTSIVKLCFAFKPEGL